jgi:hypothetical protein
MSQEESTEPWQAGEEVSIIAGPLLGTQGKLISTRTGNKMLIELHSMKQNIFVSYTPKFSK